MGAAALGVGTMKCNRHALGEMASASPPPPFPMHPLDLILSPALAGPGPGTCSRAPLAPHPLPSLRTNWKHLLQRHLSKISLLCLMTSYLLAPRWVMSKRFGSACRGKW